MKSKSVNSIEILKWILSGSVTFVIAILGGLCHKGGNYNEVICSVIIIGLVICLGGGTIVSIVMKKRFVDSLDRENLQQELLKQREHAAEIAKEKINTMKKLIKAIDFCSVLVMICVSVIVFCFFAVVFGI